ncbi:hypothetical protein EV385_5322 [Krasilnikovia cinnamomea]|uniref:Uncharacterized protein n=1 Tax=Krasilnikovia cinnamomea TaxID=349313 RepID=A0A4Q7ZQJ8_9ACTN|nr:hypothetical protein EV385_5322 [Krasilnikovia cinnamomea]
MHIDSGEYTHVFALDMEQSAGLMRHAHEAYAVAVRHRQPAMIHANDLGLLLHGYAMMRRRLAAEPTSRSSPAATLSTVPQRADRPPERPIDHQLLRALRAVATRHAGREVCQETQQKQP